MPLVLLPRRCPIFRQGGGNHLPPPLFLVPASSDLGLRSGHIRVLLRAAAGRVPAREETAAQVRGQHHLHAPALGVGSDA